MAALTNISYVYSLSVTCYHRGFEFSIQFFFIDNQRSSSKYLFAPRNNVVAKVFFFHFSWHGSVNLVSSRSPGKSKFPYFLVCWSMIKESQMGLVQVRFWTPRPICFGQFKLLNSKVSIKGSRLFCANDVPSYLPKIFSDQGFFSMEIFIRSGRFYACL